MSFEISTGVRNAQLIAMAAEMNGGTLKIYGDPVSAAAADALVPASPNDSIGSATLLCTISNAGAGTGINFEAAPVAGIIAKLSSEEWYGANAASGYASFYRFSAIGDAGGASTTLTRLQGTVDVLNCDLSVASKYLTIAEEQRVDTYYVGMPESA
ncbi:MAG: hypothetical protein PF589_12295 [Gammaproteobacteria bacterium]|jgi:hypothetical protein|nr:hypothetical protein [Gammaproteobacteria bacterium]